MLRPIDAIRIHYTQPGGITGHIMLLCMLLIFTTAHSKIRQRSYEGFWYNHHFFIIFYLALLCHGTGCFVRDSTDSYSPFEGGAFWEHCIGYQSFRWELFPLAIYLAERIYRFYRSRKGAKVLTILRHAPKLLEIRFEKEGMEYKAGQWIFVKFPDIMANQWHPFSMSSCPEDPYVSIHIQQLGDFTGTFADAFDTKADHYQLAPTTSTDVQELRLKQGQMFPRIRIDGPYSSLAEDIFKHEVSVMVGAGIGVTPWASILKSVWHLRNDPVKSAKSRLKRLEFIWVCKDISHYKWLHEQIAALEEQSRALGSESRWPILRSRVFITRQIGPLRLGEFDLHVMGSNSELGLTSKIPISPNVSSISDSSSASSSTVHFQAEMHYGRPEFLHELNVLAQELVDDEYLKDNGRLTMKIKANVYYCGPDAPGKALRDACLRVARKEVKFRFRKVQG
jgi:NADPH oxidase